jgi:hypothetical protein
MVFDGSRHQWHVKSVQFEGHLPFGPAFAGARAKSFTEGCPDRVNRSMPVDAGWWSGVWKLRWAMVRVRININCTFRGELSDE